MKHQIISKQHDTIDLITDEVLGQTSGIVEKVLAESYHEMSGVAKIGVHLPAGISLKVSKKQTATKKTVNLWD